MADQLVYGLHAVTALLKHPHRPVHRLLLSQERQDNRIQQLVKLAEHAGIPMEFVSAQKMKQQYPDLSHQGVLAITGRLPEFGESDLVHLVAACKKPPLILILDSVTDPHNLGACLRTADAAGVDFVIIPKDKSAGITPVVSKVACGAAESIPVVKVTNLARSMEIIKQEGVWLYGAAGEVQESIYQLDLKASVALVMGAEGSGLRRLTREHCDGLFGIPMLGSVESLNVSVAAAISLYEAVRQRLG
ncbi:tRNA/rRNA methyltransferase [Legionella birminghamensis]|uniref:23S rRNA (guanosine-2'-O-)-methyltransferase RlmB n=1 Tax=Legionella birminghamensis TaxID=28083 RepID=A0A378IEE3_9GAMM|nr:23S rRNA (guanosine(2251)-2'-O)-methyltransferase RlmB [Legionella birminghamensis]KTC75337.1 tRNA/rRNA methyltransferase [Legionella birminghamensis]STX33105.1 tRNA/rRNA methyltransferase [Legionella birminghamensis]